MPTLTPRDLEQAVAATTSLLGPVTDLDWSVPAGDLEWNCWQTAAHVAHDLLAYACQLTARAQDAYLPLDLVVRPGASPAQALQAVESSAALLRLAVDDAGPQARAWHFGLTDPSGFTTMGVTELVVHTWDVARGLGLEHEPPDGLAQGVLDRLWPHAPRGPAGQVLLWCTGRVALPGHPRTGDWVRPDPAPTGRDDQDW